MVVLLVPLDFNVYLTDRNIRVRCISPKLPLILEAVDYPDYYFKCIDGAQDALCKTAKPALVWTKSAHALVLGKTVDFHDKVTEYAPADRKRIARFFACGKPGGKTCADPDAIARLDGDAVKRKILLDIRETMIIRNRVWVSTQYEVPIFPECEPYVKELQNAGLVARNGHHVTLGWAKNLESIVYARCGYGKLHCVLADSEPHMSVDAWLSALDAGAPPLAEVSCTSCEEETVSPPPASPSAAVPYNPYASTRNLVVRKRQLAMSMLTKVPHVSTIRPHPPSLKLHVHETGITALWVKLFANGECPRVLAVSETAMRQIAPKGATLVRWTNAQVARQFGMRPDGLCYVSQKANSRTECWVRVGKTFRPINTVTLLMNARPAGALCFDAMENERAGMDYDVVVLCGRADLTLAYEARRIAPHATSIIHYK